MIHPPFNFRARDVLFGLVRAMSFLRKGCSGVVVGVSWGVGWGVGWGGVERDCRGAGYT